jgi:predicted lipoprotein with Yx(FWY)xxD motif
MDGRTRAALVVSAGVLTAGTLALGAWAASPPASAKSSPKTLTLRMVTIPDIGTVLANDSGHTLYRYTLDPAGKATCTGACAKAWPPLLVPKGDTRVKAADGVKGVSIARVSGGHRQVFFHHEALYMFVSDTKAGEARGQGVENDWFAVLSDGKSSDSGTTTSAQAQGATATTAPATTKTPTTTSSTPSSTNASPPVTQSTSPSTTPPKAPPTTITTQPTTTTTVPPGGGIAF